MPELPYSPGQSGALASGGAQSSALSRLGDRDAQPLWEGEGLGPLMFLLEDTGPEEERGLFALGSCLGRPSHRGVREQGRLRALEAHRTGVSLRSLERARAGGRPRRAGVVAEKEPEDAGAALEPAGGSGAGRGAGRGADHPSKRAEGSEANYGSAPPFPTWRGLHGLAADLQDK